MMLSRRMLSKEDEAIAEEAEVRREDQDKINKFSRLHSRETILEEELRSKAKTKEDLEEISTELELANEDEKVMNRTLLLDPAQQPLLTERVSRYKIGDAFVHLPLSEAQELLASSSAGIDSEVSNLEEMLSAIREEMQKLKVDLYARFGKSINLEK